MATEDTATPIVEPVFTLAQIRAAFWNEFHARGEVYFNYLYTDEENAASTESHWTTFEHELINPKVK